MVLWYAVLGILIYVNIISGPAWVPQIGVSVVNSNIVNRSVSPSCITANGPTSIIRNGSHGSGTSAHQVLRFTYFRHHLIITSYHSFDITVLLYNQCDL